MDYGHCNTFYTLNLSSAQTEKSGLNEIEFENAVCLNLLKVLVDSVLS